MTLPVLYSSTETNFGTLGLGVLVDVFNAFVIEERNGQFYLEFDYPVSGRLFKDIKNDRLIKADASNNLKDQRFKIVKITKPSNGIISIYAEHISYHTQELQLKPRVVFNGTAQQALNTWKSNIIAAHPFTVYSSMSHESQGEWTIDKVDNARSALGGVAGSILDNYRGEYRFDNYHIGLYADRGNDNGAFIAYGKNLTELEQEEEIANIYTSIYPYSIIENNDGIQTTITLPELFIDTEYMANYARRKIMKIDFSEEKIETVAALRSRAIAYGIANKVGLPKVNLKVKFLDLAKTLDYKQLKLVEEINLCDWITIYFEKYGIKQKVKVIKTTWDILLDRYEEIELGEAKSSLTDSIENNLGGLLTPIVSRLNTIQVAANGKNKVFRGPTQPTEGMSTNDLWYKPVGDGEIELYNFNGTIWKIEKVSAGLLKGTLDAENGDINLINVNVANIVGETSNFVRSAWNEINSNADIDGNRLRFVHTDGTSTEIGVNGIKRITTSDNRNYHYMFYSTTFIYGESSSNARWIQLPNDYKGKQFKVYLAIADSMTAPSYYYSIQRFVCCVHPDHDIDYINARVPVIAYKSNTLMNGNEPVIDTVQGLIFAIY